jgi:hypothetical protein
LFKENVKFVLKSTAQRKKYAVRKGQLSQILLAIFQLLHNLRKTEKLNFQPTEKARLLTVALPRSFLVSSVLTCFCDSFVSFDGTKS